MSEARSRIATDSHQAWILSRLICGHARDRLPLGDLTGGWKQAAEVMIQSGYKAFQAWSAAQEGFEPYLQAILRIKPGDPDPARVNIRTKTRWTMAELLSTEFEEPPWAVPAIVPVGLSALGGRPKVGKSWLALQFAHAVGTGGQVLGEAVEPAPVLYVALEDPPRRLRERSIKQGIPRDAVITAVTQWPNLGLEGGLAKLQDEIAQEGYGLVIIDTLSRAIGRADQMDIAQMTDILGNLQQISHLHDVAILVIDHHRKSSGFESSPVDDLMGSTAKTAVCDAVLGLYKEQGKAGATLKLIGRDIEERDLALEWDATTWSWQYRGEAGKVMKDSFKAEVLQAIELITKLDDLPTTTAIAEHLGKEKSHISRALADLLSEGFVVKGEKQGREQPYYLADQARDQK